MKAVFYHKPDSPYDDAEGVRYHFPQSYLTRVERTVGDWIVYYGPLNERDGRYYTGTARVGSIAPHPERPKHYYAFLVDYIDFDRAVEYKENGGFERRLVQSDGQINQGYKVQAVRLLDEAEYAAIVKAGLSALETWPDPDVHGEGLEPFEADVVPEGFAESPQPEFLDEEFSRPVIELITRRKWRDIKFRHNVRVAYDRTCAFTGLRLINGHGRPEVAAAHIRPVERGGNDWIRNGIALSGTVHWMFDRGLLSLSDDLTILKSRHLNHDVSHLINKDMKAHVPKEIRLQPHPIYLSWHRQSVFKG